MSPKTIRRLNQINLDFYAKVGSKIWNTNMNYYWEGWENLARLVQPPKNKVLRVLDLGCGNGRFAHFLAETFVNLQIKYVGVDFSKPMIDLFEDSLFQNLQTKFLTLDLIKNNWSQELSFNKQKFDLIGMFGLLHHIPSYQLRLRIIQNLIELMADNGVLAMTFWRFLDLPRLKKRIVKPETTTGRLDFQRLGLEPKDLELGDYILDWVKIYHSFRFSHYFYDQEIKKLVQDLNLKIIAKYINDGRNQDRNKYLVLQK